MRRAHECYPVESLVTGKSEQTLRTLFTQAAQRQFKAQLHELDPRIVAKLEQPFGKENLTQCFRAEAALRHTLLPLWKSGMLAGCEPEWTALAKAYYPARLLKELLDEYGDVPFEGIRGYNPDWETETDVNKERVAMATAALLHFNGSMADLVRWIGGPHVGAYRDHDAIIATLKASEVDPRVVADLARIFYQGIPALCNVSASEENFAAYFRYGNHSTVDDVPEKTHKAMVKDARKGYTLLLDERAILLMLHCHVTPQGIVDLNTMHKNPRPIFDSSFRPYPWCFAINDWTHKDNEPPLTFASAEMGFMVWLYNLRITYPDKELYIADDDVSGAFRLMRYHPNLMALHTSRQAGYCVINTGGTFGDNTSPSNFDPIGLARRQLAWYMWKHDLTSTEQVKMYLPELRMATAPTPEEVRSFTRADPDELNRGVLDSEGQRLAPPYNMHVDDNLYADVGEFLVHTISTSVNSLFQVLGPPTNPLVPSPLSMDKFEAFYDHRRKLVGRRFDSRTLSVGLLDYKREQLQELLSEWSVKPSFELLEIAQLLGVLENHTRYARWARCWYSSLQNAVRRMLFQRHKILERIYSKAGKRQFLTRQLPSYLAHRVDTLIARDRAQLLWATKQRFFVDEDMKTSIGHLLAYVSETADPWEVPLGMIIPRKPHFYSRGDASHVGGGAYCLELRFWFEIIWSPTTVNGIKNVAPSAPGYVHINSLEFIVVILQLAAIRTRLETMTSESEVLYFPSGRPAIPVWHGETDNSVSKSWENRATARTSQGQGLVSVYAELLRTSMVHTQCEHLAGTLNEVADDISRNDFSLPYLVRTKQLFLKHPSLASLDYFQPSQGLLQLLTSRLYSRHTPVPCELPQTLGQFLPAGSITSISVSL